MKYRLLSFVLGLKQKEYGFLRTLKNFSLYLCDKTLRYRKHDKFLCGKFYIYLLFIYSDMLLRKGLQNFTNEKSDSFLIKSFHIS